MLLDLGVSLGAAWRRVVTFPLVAFLGGFGVWLLPGMAPVLYVWRGRRDYSVALLILAMQIVFGLYSWKYAIAYERQKAKCYKRKSA